VVAQALLHVRDRLEASVGVLREAWDFVPVIPASKEERRSEKEPGRSEGGGIAEKIDPQIQLTNDK
jgi:hypothetical protein